MPKIGLLSDTHGFLDDKVFTYLKDCDELWHAGDFGSLELSQKLSDFKPLRGVYGNIDDKDIQLIHPKNLEFEVEGFRIWMTHIGGYPGHYAPDVRKKLAENPPDIFVCGHSHILRVMTDKKYNNMVTLNPGAAGNQGFHQIKTIMRFDLNEKRIENMQAIELGKRG